MDLVERLTAVVTDLSLAQDRVLVGIDGPDAAGKTTLANRLAYVRVSPEESLRRARVRDLEVLRSHEQIERRYLGRYLPGQALYRSAADPEAAAHVVVDNERTDVPAVERWAVPVPGDRGEKR
jgi:thymidylate kinase